MVGWIDPHDHVLHLLAKLGVTILLFEIGLETDLKKLLQVGGRRYLGRLGRRGLAVCARLWRLSISGARRSEGDGGRERR